MATEEGARTNGPIPGLDAAVAASKARNLLADKTIFAFTLIVVVLGFIPVNFDIWIIVAIIAVMTVAIGHIYGYTSNTEQGGHLLKQILVAIIFTVAVWKIGFLFFETATNHSLPADMLLSAILEGGLAFALGQTAKSVFARGCKMDREAMERDFTARFKARRKPEV